MTPLHRRSFLAAACSAIHGAPTAKFPRRHAIGNHDIFGWRRLKSGTTGQEPDWGKKYATELFALPGRYYSFDQAG